MQKTDEIQDYERYARQFDNMVDNREWKDTPAHNEYNYTYIQNLRNSLKKARISNDVKKVMSILKMHRYRNIGNILNEQLYNKLYFGTKALIESFFQELELDINMIENSPQLTLNKKLEFIIETRHALGRTGFVLSGGGLLGMYHFGFAKALFQYNIFPKIVSGSSAGSISSAFIGSLPLEQLLKIEQGGINWTSFQSKEKTFFRQIWANIQRFITTGVLLDINRIRNYMRDNIGDITFQEAYDKTGVILNISVTGKDNNQQGRILNYITAPNVVVWSAVACSCSIPLIYGMSELMIKNERGEIELFSEKLKFIDGSIFSDIPFRQLQETFNVNNLIVSQVNPFVVPFQNFSNKQEDNIYLYYFLKILDVIRNLITDEIKHKINSLAALGILPFFLQQLASLFQQEFNGHVTIIPSPTLKDYLKILDVPKSNEEMMYFQKRSIKDTVKKIFFIKMTMKYEEIIDHSFQKLHQKFQHVQLQQGKNCLNIQNNNNLNSQLSDQGQYQQEFSESLDSFNDFEEYENLRNLTQSFENDIEKQQKKQNKQIDLDL